MTNYQRSERGPGVIGEAAKGFEEIIHKGWTGQLSSATVDIIGDIASNDMFLPEAKCLLDRQIFSDDDWGAKKEPRWLNEEEYRVRLGKRSGISLSAAAKYVHVERGRSWWFPRMQ